MKKISIAHLIIALMMLFPATGVAAGGVTHGGDIIYTKPVKSVTFSHKVHVEEKGLSCDMCHSKFFEMQALKSQEKSDFNMDSLYKGKYCGVCHDGKMAFAANTRCASCHSGVKGAAGSMEKEHQ